MPGDTALTSEKRGEARRVIFVNRFFHPDQSATSLMLTDIATAPAASGTQVEVITSRLRYDCPEIRLPAAETGQGVMVTRLATPGFGRQRLFGHMIDDLTF